MISKEQMYENDFSPLVEETNLFPFCVLGALAKCCLTLMCGFISELSTMLHWSVCLWYVVAYCFDYYNFAI